MLSDVVADQVAARRRLLGMNRDELANRCRDLGLELSASAIANIETGRRGSDGKRRRELTVDEVVVLSRALDIAPILLIFPVGQVPEINYLCESTVSTWDAAEWFAGRSDTPPDVLSAGRSDGGGHSESDDRELVYRKPVRLFADHDRAAESVWRWRARARVENGETAKSLAMAEDTLAMIRDQIVAEGFSVPPTDGPVKP